eukprot:Opistho-1_new@107946
MTRFARRSFGRLTLVRLALVKKETDPLTMACPTTNVDSDTDDSDTFRRPKNRSCASTQYSPIGPSFRTQPAVLASASDGKCSVCSAGLSKIATMPAYVSDGTETAVSAVLEVTARLPRVRDGSETLVTRMLRATSTAASLHPGAETTLRTGFAVNRSVFVTVWRLAKLTVSKFELNAKRMSSTDCRRGKFASTRDVVVSTSPKYIEVMLGNVRFRSPNVARTMTVATLRRLPMSNATDEKRELPESVTKMFATYRSPSFSTFGIEIASTGEQLSIRTLDASTSDGNENERWSGEGYSTFTESNTMRSAVTSRGKTSAPPVLTCDNWSGPDIEDSEGNKDALAEGRSSSKIDMLCAVARDGASSGGHAEKAPRESETSPALARDGAETEAMNDESTLRPPVLCSAGSSMVMFGEIKPVIARVPVTPCTLRRRDRRPLESAPDEPFTKSCRTRQQFMPLRRASDVSLSTTNSASQGSGDTEDERENVTPSVMAMAIARMSTKMRTPSVMRNWRWERRVRFCMRRSRKRIRAMSDVRSESSSSSSDAMLAAARDLRKRCMNGVVSASVRDCSFSRISAR